MTLLKRIKGAEPGGSPNPIAQKEEKSIKQIVLEGLLSATDGAPDLVDEVALRRKASRLLTSALAIEKTKMPQAERKAVLDQIVADLVLGPLALCLEDTYITDIMVVGPDKVYVNRRGSLERSPLHFQSEEHLRRAIDWLLALVGTRMDESQPLFEGRLPGSAHNYLRIQAVIPPVAIDGSVLTVRKFGKYLLTVQNIIDYGTATVVVMEFLRACVIAGINILISGGEDALSGPRRGPGKTTLLDILCGFIPTDERIVTIEENAELALRQEHVVSLESRPASVEGAGEVTVRDLLLNAQRMRPDRLVIGELRGSEAFDLIQAINTGRGGALSALRASSPSDALARLEVLCQLSAGDAPARAVREQIASAVQLIVQLDRLPDFSIKITHVSEVQGMKGDEVMLSDVFVFEQTGTDRQRIVGQLKPTGFLPKCMDRIRDAGIQFPPQIFGGEVESQ